MDKIETICCAAGKSGGHIIPNLQWAKQYNKKILFFSADTSLDYRLLENAVDTHVPLCLRAPRWYSVPLFAYQFFAATLKGFYHLYQHMPTRVLSTGGITALPICIAAFCLRIPIELFELNATPGSAIRWLAPLASKINICFESAKIYFDERKVVIRDYPVRFNQKMREEEIFSDLDRKTIFIQGGSQGSLSLNKKVKAYIEENPDQCNHINIIHQIGLYDQFDWRTFYRNKKIPAIVFSFEDQLAHYYRIADLVICRAGSGQLFEVLHFNIPCITIPLELPGNTHQLTNAQAMQYKYPHLFKLIRQDEQFPQGVL